MKKIFAILLAVTLMMSLSVTAFAASSPVAGQKVTIIYVAHEDAKLDVDTHEWSDKLTVTYTADEEYKGQKFTSWSIFLKDGTAAMAGKHYKEVKKAGNVIEIIPLTDLIVAANYGTAATNVDDAVKAFQTSSPETGDIAIVGLSAAMLTSLAGAYVAKKKSK